MISTKEKIKKSKLVFLWGFVTWAITEVAMMWLWYQVIMHSEWDTGLLYFVFFTVLVTFVGAFAMRGMERHSIGVDIHKMDEQEIEILISILERQKRDGGLIKK